MDRNQALQWVESELANDKLIKHVLAVEAIMRALAAFLDCDVGKWGLTGLLHDIDLAATAMKPHKHTLVAEKWLIERAVAPDIIQAIKAHAGKTEPTTEMDWALYCSDPLSGLIVASVLKHPSGKLSELTGEFLLKRYKEKRFAAGANREAIAACDKLGLSLDKFFEIALEGVRNVSDQLGF